jgi:hypothetical protein
MKGAAFTVLLCALLTGCAAAPAVIAAVASGASLAHSLYTVGGDIVAATSVACEALPAAHARAPGNAALPWYDALCGRLDPANPNLDTGSPAWVAAGLAKVP